MTSLKEKLKGIINSPLENNYQKINIKNQSHKLSYIQIKGNNQSRGEIVSQIKNKIREFKRNRENYNDDLLNFEVSREALQKYYRHDGENNIKEKLNNSMNVIKSGKINQNNNNDMLNFATPTIRIEDNSNYKNFLTDDNEKENKKIFDIKKNQIISNSKLNVYEDNNNKTNYEKNDNFLNIDIKNIFKNKNPSLSTFSKNIKTKSNPNTKSSREYIKFNKNQNEPYSINKYTEKNKNKNKIQNQINLFVKELNNSNSNYKNYTSSMKTREMNDTFKNKKRNKSSYTSNSHYINNLYQNNYKNINNNPKINLLYIQSIKENLTEMSKEEIENLPKEYINELKDLSKLINKLF